MYTHSNIVADIVRFARSSDIAVSANSAQLLAYAQDFGHMTSSEPICILQPKNSLELLEIIQMAKDWKIPITPRGRGLSQSGQSLSPQGISLDMTKMMDVHFISDSLVRCEAGCTWRQLIQESAARSTIPHVLPLNLDLTVGGTLSAGGFGASSFKYGPAIAHVVELEVVIGTGEIISCSSEHRPDVFHSALGGQGRCGVITAATIRLKSLSESIRTYYLAYNDIETLLHDQHWLETQANVLFVEGFCIKSCHGLRLAKEGRQPFFYWSYGLHVSIDINSRKDDNDDSQDWLSELHFDQRLLVEETTMLEYLSRYDARFQVMRNKSQWNSPHPWFEAFLSPESALQLIPQYLEMLPAYMGDGHRILSFPKTDISPLFMQPNSAQVIAFAVLPMAVPASKLLEVREVLETMNTLLTQQGGKRYLSGWLGDFDEHRIQQHYASKYQYWRELKASLDPDSVFQSLLFRT